MPSYAGFTHVLNKLRLHSFDTKELLETALNIDGQFVSAFLFYFSTKQVFSGNVAEFCTLLEETGDPCKLVTVAEAARRLNKPGLAEVIEDAILEVCLQTNSSAENGRDDDVDSIRKKVFETLLEMYKRMNLDDRMAQFTREMDTAVFKSLLPLHCSFPASTAASKSFKTFNVNPAAFYHCRPLLEREILKQLKLTADSPHSGALSIVGGPGTGKTAIMSYLLTDKTSHDFLLNECQLNVAIWLNCHQWRGEAAFDAAKFTRTLVHWCRQAAPNMPTGELSDLADVVSYLETSQPCRPLFVFDDVFDIRLLEYLCPTAVCCVITQDNLATIGSTIVMPKMDDGEVRTALETTYDLAGNLSDELIDKLARRCYGLPLILSLIGPRFRFCITSRSYQDEYNRLMIKLTIKDSQLKTIQTLFEMSFEQLEDDQLRTMYYTFLLFDPGEAVHVADLAVLWGLLGEKRKQQALVKCDRYHQLSLVRRLAVQQQMPAFFVHQGLHEAAFRYAQSKLDVETLYELRLQLVTGLCFHFQQAQLTYTENGCFSVIFQKRDDSIDVLRRIFQLQRRHLLERTIQNLDAKNLLKICQLEIPQSGCVSPFLQFLFNFQWKDDIMSSNEHQVSMNCNSSWRLVAKLLVKLFRSGDKVEIAHVLNQKGSDGRCFLDEFADIDETAYHDHDGYRTLRDLLDPWLKGYRTSNTYLDETFMNAVKTGNIDAIEAICESNPLALEAGCKWYGRTALFYAADRGNLQVVKFLFEKLPKAIATPDKNGQTPLSYAAERGHLDIVKFLFQQFPLAAEMADRNGQTPLSIAAEHGHVSVVKFLYRSYPKAAHMPANNGQTPILYAGERGYFEIVKSLFEKT